MNKRKIPSMRRSITCRRRDKIKSGKKRNKKGNEGTIEERERIGVEKEEKGSEGEGTQTKEV